MTVHDGLSKLSAFTEPTKVLQGDNSSPRLFSVPFEDLPDKVHGLNVMVKLLF